MGLGLFLLVVSKENGTASYRDYVGVIFPDFLPKLQ